jgi:hypothetical protein
VAFVLAPAFGHFGSTRTPSKLNPAVPVAGAHKIVSPVRSYLVTHFTAPSG